MSKKVYVCINKDNGFTLYNKVMGTWNDGEGRRDGSTVWTFSARKSPEESKTMQKAKQWLANLGYDNIEFQLRTIDDKKASEPPKDVEAAEDDISAILTEDEHKALETTNSSEVSEEADEITEALKAAV